MDTGKLHGRIYILVYYKNSLLLYSQIRSYELFEKQYYYNDIYIYIIRDIQEIR